MWQFNLASYLLLSTGLVSVTTALLLAVKQNFPGKLPMVLMMIMGAEWAMAAGFEAAATEIPLKILWSQIEYIGSMSGPVLYCYFILGFLQKEKEGISRYLWTIWIIPLLSVILAATNSLHSLLWTGFEWGSREYNSLTYFHGPWFWIAVIYAFILIFLGGFFLISAIVRFPVYFRKQAWYLIVGSALPVITTIIYVTGISPLGGFDISPIGFLFAGLLFVSGIIRKRMFDILPIAHHVILENMMAGVLVLDEHQRILDINPAAREMLKISTEIDGGNAIGEFPELSVLLEKAQEKNRKRTEILMSNPERWLEITLTPLIEKNKKIEGSLIMLRDITSRKRYEQKLTELNLQLSDSEKQLKELNTQKDKLFSVIAHDLKNPFNALLGFSRILHDEGSEMETGEIHKFSGYILKAAQQGYDILLNLLEWSRSQTNRIDFQPQPYSIQELIKGTISNIDYMVQAKDIKLEQIRFSDTRVMVDRHMIETVLRNLLSNAIKFSPRKGTIIVSVEHQDSFCAISIQDFGTGISDEDQTKIFRLDCLHSSKGTEDEQGSGLGLILCKDFTEKNKGHIKLISKPGQGSTFTILLPCA